jgi:hypothetical protein
MISIIGSLLGFSTSFLPKLLSTFAEQKKFKNEMAMLQVQSKMKVSEANALAKIQQNKSIYEHDQTIVQNTSSKFINNLRSSVRPILTYFLFITYIGFKIILIIIAIQEGDETLIAIRDSYGEEDMGLLSIVISFWFGSRLQK